MSELQPSEILKCLCRHDGQDHLHGAQMRVHKLCRGTSNAGKYRCTVCSLERSK